MSLRELEHGYRARRTVTALDASRRPGFDLMSFHDRLWLEGNVPLALQRLEIR